MIEIQLPGTNTASALGEEVTTRHKRGPIGPLCRLLVHQGVAAESDLVVILRGNTQVFHPAPLSSYTRHDVIDTDNHGLQRQKHRPFDWDSKAA